MKRNSGLMRQPLVFLLALLTSLALVIPFGGGSARADSPEVSFTDDALKALVLKGIQEKLADPSIDKITEENILSVTSISKQSSGVVNLDGLRYAKNLKILSLPRYAKDDPEKIITDISELASLENIEQVTLDGQQVSDLSPLANKESLKTLGFDGNQISDVSVLGKLPNLTSLSVKRNTLSSFAGITAENFPALKNLSMTNNGLQNDNPGQADDNMSYLANVLDNIASFKNLDLQNNAITDFSAFGKLREKGVKVQTKGQVWTVRVPGGTAKETVTLPKYVDVDGTVLQPYKSPIEKKAGGVVGTTTTASGEVSVELVPDSPNTLNPQEALVEYLVPEIYGVGTGTYQYRVKTNIQFLPTLEVIFDPANGEETTSAKVLKGALVSAPESDPTKVGFNFAGWFAEDAEDAFNFGEPITENITLFAHWDPVIYQVTFDSQGGSEVIPNPVDVKYGEKVAEPDPAPTREGYTFKGWYKAKDTTVGTRSVSELPAELEPYDFDSKVTASFTLYAMWEINTYTVTFDSQGGSEVAPQSVTHGNPVDAPADPTKEGYTFKGWLLDGKAYDFGSPVTADLELFADWSKNDLPKPEPTAEPTPKPDGKPKPKPAKKGDTKLPTTGASAAGLLAGLAVVGGIAVLRNRKNS